jgi:hypothetical protein
MLITRTSILSGIKRTIDLPVTQNQMADWVDGGVLLQHAFPDLTPDQREFILNGITTEEWDAAFPEEEE